MTTHEQQLAEIYVEMLNTHAPDLVDRFVTENYVNHNAFRRRRTRGEPPVLDWVLRRPARCDRHDGGSGDLR